MFGIKKEIVKMHQNLCDHVYSNFAYINYVNGMYCVRCDKCGHEMKFYTVQNLVEFLRSNVMSLVDEYYDEEEE